MKFKSQFIKRAVEKFLSEDNNYSFREKENYSTPRNTEITVRVNKRLGKENQVYYVELYNCSLRPELLHGFIENGYTKTSFTYTPKSTKTIKEFLVYIMRRELLMLKSTINHELLSLETEEESE